MSDADDMVTLVGLVIIGTKPRVKMFVKVISFIMRFKF